MVLFRPHTSSTARGADPARTSGSASSRQFPCVLPTAGRGITPGALSEEPSPRRGVAEGPFVYKAPSSFGLELRNGGAAHSVRPHCPHALHQTPPNRAAARGAARPPDAPRKPTSTTLAHVSPSPSSPPRSTARTFSAEALGFGTRGTVVSRPDGRGGVRGAGR
jgi:hypothetical protein